MQTGAPLSLQQKENGHRDPQKNLPEQEAGSGQASFSDAHPTSEYEPLERNELASSVTGTGKSNPTTNLAKIGRLLRTGL